MLVMCASRQVPFRRSVRNSAGGIVRTLEFQPGDPVEITSESDLDAIAGDIGHALIEVELDEKGRARLVAPRPSEAEPQKPRRGKQRRTELAVT